jgi:hypothetical protein
MKAQSILAISMFLVILTLSSCVPPSPPATPTLAPTEAMSPSETPKPTDTLAPTNTPTDTPTATPIPVAGDFEVNTEGWGDFPEGGTLVENKGVKQNCELPAHTGKCLLEGNQLTGTQKNGGNNFYLARYATDGSFDNKLISIWVYIPDPTLFSNGARHSTAKIIVWDKDWGSHESEKIELVQSGWNEITFDLTGAKLPTTYNAVGVHFFVQTGYTGPFYIDTVTAK